MLEKAAYTQYVYKLPELAQGALAALVPLAITVVMFAVGLYFERLAGTLLVLTSFAMIGWGIFEHWGEVVLWATALIFLVAPAAFAGILYVLASRTQEVQELRSGRHPPPRSPRSAPPLSPSAPASQPRNPYAEHLDRLGDTWRLPPTHTPARPARTPRRLTRRRGASTRCRSDRRRR